MMKLPPLPKVGSSDMHDVAHERISGGAVQEYKQDPGGIYIVHNAEAAITRIETFYSKGQEGRAEYTLGSLEFVEIDLLDLASVKRAAEDFSSREGPDGRLDVLFNNAGTGALKNAPSSPQGHEYHFSINVSGGFLLTRLLAPILSRTACNLPPNSVRVVWSASVMVDMMSPESGINPQFLRDTRTVQDVAELYATSKAAGWFLASEFARRQVSSNSGVVSVAGNPGDYVTNVWRHTSTMVYYFFRPVLRAPVHGAKTYLWMAFPPSVTVEEASAGRYAICDGRWHPAPRDDLGHSNLPTFCFHISSFGVLNTSRRTFVLPTTADSKFRSFRVEDPFKGRLQSSKRDV
ncbi:hypothetical protein EKO27_g7665 [Xylaria grammica]|uniref:Uncharacterized protein n=1 Tax=Xylaria grammica TaxID=363999 RepID=A0A439CZ48_9PEZI|nr:hypothetical protein EKO27_g7665 [Xylaria grammica]